MRPIANIRQVMAVGMPLPQLTPEQAADVVGEPLVNGTRSRKR